MIFLVSYSYEMSAIIVAIRFVIGDNIGTNVLVTGGVTLEGKVKSEAFVQAGHSMEPVSKKEAVRIIRFLVNNSQDEEVKRILNIIKKNRSPLVG